MNGKSKRSYYLPVKLIKTFDAECQRAGLVREKVLSAALHRFLQCGPEERAAMFEQLDKDMRKKR